MANPLSTIFQKLRNFSLFKGGSDSVIGVDVGSSAIKVVQLRRKGDVAVLETYGEIALGPYAGKTIGQAVSLSAGKLSEALVDVMREANVTSRSGGISIPFTSSLVTMIDMPVVSNSELQKIIPLEARKYIPVPINEVSLDWFVLPQKDEEMLLNEGEDNAPGSGKTKVLLVAIHNDVLNKYQDIVKSSELEVDFYEIEIFSSVRATIGHTIAPVGVLDIGSGKTKLYIVEYGVVKLSHLINQGSQDLTFSLSRSLGMTIENAEEYKREKGLLGENERATEALRLPLDRVLSEVNRTLISYERRYNHNIGRLILVGGGSVLKGFLPLASDKLETEVVLGDPFAKAQSPAFLDEALKKVGPEFAVAVGLALRKLGGGK